MGIGKQLRDEIGFGSYVRERILPLAPDSEPAPFRGFMGEGEEPLPFLEEIESWLAKRRPGAFNVLGSSGSGKTLFARWAAARWGQQFLDEPDLFPIPLWLDSNKLGNLSPLEALTVGHLAKAALAREVSDSALRGLVDLARDHPFLIVFDRSEDSEMDVASFLTPRDNPFQLLHLSIAKRLEGPSVRLAPWVRETALLFAHQRRGEEGVRRIEALQRSPAAAVLSYPLFTAHLVEREETPLEEIERTGGVPLFLGDLFRSLPGRAGDYPMWCRGLLLTPELSAAYAISARRLHLPPSGTVNQTRGPEGYGSVFHAFLLAELIRGRRAAEILRKRPLQEEELAILERILTPSEAQLQTGIENSIDCANRINLHWRILKRPVPDQALQGALSRLRLPEYSFPKGLHSLNLSDSDLSGIKLQQRRSLECRFSRSRLDGADLSNAEFRSVHFSETKASFSDFSESRFSECRFANMDLTLSVLAGARFVRTRFVSTVFGTAGKGEQVCFDNCRISDSDLRRLAAGGLFCKLCRLENLNFQGLEIAKLECPETTFERCDLIDLAAPGAQLKAAHFLDCLLSGVDLRGADLRKAYFQNVDFQPGPASRAGLTEESTRTHPLYGSQSGFYAGEVVEGVYGDPELLRTADFRNADLRGATFQSTDLFRVDLRGARLDARAEALARRMGAFLD